MYIATINQLIDSFLTIKLIANLYDNQLSDFSNL